MAKVATLAAHLQSVRFPSAQDLACVVSVNLRECRVQGSEFVDSQGNLYACPALGLLSEQVARN